MMRFAFALALLPILSAPVTAQQAPAAQPAVSPPVQQATAREQADPIPAAARAQARRDCYAENIALDGNDLRAAMRRCMEAAFPGVRLYAGDGLTRDGKPTAAAARAACRSEIDGRGLAGQERIPALVACFAGKRPDLAQRAECRKEVRGRGLTGEALREAVAACAAVDRS